MQSNVGLGQIGVAVFPQLVDEAAQVGVSLAVGGRHGSLLVAGAFSLVPQAPGNQVFRQVLPVQAAANFLDDRGGAFDGPQHDLFVVEVREQVVPDINDGVLKVFRVHVNSPPF